MQNYEKVSTFAALKFTNDLSQGSGICRSIPKGQSKRFYRKTCAQDNCPDGGIGRRAGLKHQWPRGCAGSTPAPGTLRRGNYLIFKQLPLLLFFKCSQIVPRESLHKIPNFIHHPILYIVELPEMRFRTLDFLLLFNTQFINID